uniref:Uncharacterized protein n=1 Tax=Dictyoglomus turgidum TaxID=513050 RepID=A0A7C3WP71_9BACT
MKRLTTILKAAGKNNTWMRLRSKDGKLEVGVAAPPCIYIRRMDIPFDGDCCVSIKDFVALISRVDKIGKIDIRDERLRISNGNEDIFMSIPLQDKQEFIELPTTGFCILKGPLKEFKAILKKVIPFMKNSDRLFLHQVNITNGNMEGTDGHVLIRYPMNNFEIGKQIKIKKEAFPFILALNDKNKEIEIFELDKFIGFLAGSDEILYVSKSEDMFPDVDKVISNHSGLDVVAEITISKETLKSIIKRMPEGRTMVIKVDKGKVEFTDFLDSFVEKVDCPNKGKIKVGFDPLLLDKAISPFDTDTVTLCMRGVREPATIECDGILAIVMPKTG